MPSGFPCRVLVVEDHAIVAEMMREMLDILGCESILANSVAAAMAVASDAYDVILCDYRLPDGEAPTLLDGVRPRAVPVVLLSGYRGEDLPDDVRGRFAACLSKPVEMETLERELRRACTAAATLS